MCRDDLGGQVETLTRQERVGGNVDVIGIGSEVVTVAKNGLNLAQLIRKDICGEGILFIRGERVGVIVANEGKIITGLDK